ncbi:type VII secretion protein EccE [Micromonospora echinofusca]|uniref:Type VII secretion protein EccE n=1 Tax=Micromonospora echinofusca TaxID=47858 RepID=A0ABS3VT14_MICEH|nr:type VII secretion protein EccE [Micromonospora echinofusca]MBO4207653.1 type VII secretion protein EccE [Micromonospora echinofusca]
MAPRTPAPDGPAVLRPRRRPGQLGPVHLIQLLLAEAALVTVAAVLGRDPVVLVAAVLGALLLLLVTLGRRQGRWWVERLLMNRAYRRRRRGVATVAAGTDPRLTALRALAPGLVVQDVPLTAGGQVGVARDDAGWYAVAALQPGNPGGPTEGDLDLNALAAALAEADQPGAVLQVVLQTVPAPSIDAHPSSPAGQSYRQLLTGFDAPPVPADRQTWIAVRLDARALAEATVDQRADLDLAPAVVAALLRRVVKPLRRAGLGYRLLDADELVQALLNSCDLDPAGTLEPHATPPREEWSAWHSGRLVHRSYWVRSWPEVGQAGALLGWLGSSPSAMTTVSLILAPEDTDGMTDLRGLVRVAAPANESAPLCQALVRGAEQRQATLFPLDGEQGPAVYATAPTGGGAR